MRAYRYLLPAWTLSASVARLRCASARAEVVRMPIASSTVDGRPAFVRARTESACDRRHKMHAPKSLSLEIDVPGPDGSPVGATRVDVPITDKAGLVREWLTMLGREHQADRCTVGRGHWGDAHLTLEDRGQGRLLVEVQVLDGLGWACPEEWKGAVDVSSDPAWSRPLVSSATWPVPISPVELRVDGPVWGRPVVAQPAHPDLAEPSGEILDAALTTWEDDTP